MFAKIMLNALLVVIELTSSFFLIMLTKNKLHTQVVYTGISLLVACRVFLDVRSDEAYALKLSIAVL